MRIVAIVLPRIIPSYEKHYLTNLLRRGLEFLINDKCCMFFCEGMHRLISVNECGFVWTFFLFYTVVVVGGFFLPNNY